MSRKKIICFFVIWCCYLEKPLKLCPPVHPVEHESYSQVRDALLLNPKVAECGSEMVKVLSRIEIWFGTFKVKYILKSEMDLYCFPWLTTTINWMVHYSGQKWGTSTVSSLTEPAGSITMGRFNSRLEKILTLEKVQNSRKNTATIQKQVQLACLSYKKNQRQELRNFNKKVDAIEKTNMKCLTRISKHERTLKMVLES